MTFLKRFLLSAAALLAGTVASQAQAPARKAPPAATLARTIQVNRWKKRLLLVGAPTASHPELAQQKKLFATAAAPLKERDLLVLQLLYDQLSPTDRQYWARELKQPLTGFAVVLIGKDGGVKRTETKPVAPADLFSTVDKMPMRRAEMRPPKK